MNPFQDKVRCSVCGEPGYALAGEGVHSWFGAEFHHTDSSICADNVAKMKVKLAKLEKRLNNAEKSKKE